MLFLIEIVLTIFAWRNGWKWTALLPIGIAFFIGVIVGISERSTGVPVDITGLYFFDFAAIVALIIMLIKKGNQT